MAKPQKESKDAGVRENQVIVTAKRALGINKLYIAIAIIIGLGVLFLLNPTYVNLSKSTNQRSKYRLDCERQGRSQ